MYLCMYIKAKKTCCYLFKQNNNHFKCSEVQMFGAFNCNNLKMYEIFYQRKQTC